MSRRKDRDRFHRLKEQNPNYTGYRGANTVTAAPSAPLESVTCSVCRRRRNVPADTLPQDREAFVCLQCQEQQAAQQPDDP